MFDPISLNEVAATLYAAPLQPELWTTALRQLAKAIDIRQAGLFDHQPGSHRIFAFTGDPILEGGPLYEQHYWQYDEWVQRLPKNHPGEVVFFGESIWPEAEFKKSVFFNEFLLKHQVKQLVSISPKPVCGAFHCMSVYLEPDAPAFSSDQYQSLEFLAPSLCSAFVLRQRLSTLEGLIRDLEAAINQVSVALILLDRRGRPLMLNASAQAICDKADGLLFYRNSLSAATAAESQQLRGLIDRTVSSVSSRTSLRSGAMNISRMHGGPLHVLITPLPPGQIDDPRRAAAILLISDPDEGPVMPGDILRQLFCLTPAECRLALQLLAGDNLSDCGEKLGVGRETVRTQMKSILHKTATRRQGELIGLLRGLSSLRHEATRSHRAVGLG